MITPLDIENKKFAKQMMNGYNVDEVDDFLDELTLDYGKLYKENAELKAQREELDSNVGKYKNIENTIQNTLIMAQKTADEVQEVAKKQAEQIIKDAEFQAKNSVEELNTQILLKQKELDEALDFAVGSVVNSVGVNINTASPSLLKYISGLTSKTITNIINEKEKLHKFTSRMELKKILSDKVFEQAIGFIRINDAVNILDRTKIHPESYEKTYNLLKYLNLSVEDIGTPKIKEVLNNVVISNIEDELKIDKWTLEDIISCLKEPLRDPREDYSVPVLKEDILTIDDLKVGMKLQGVVRNVVDFGAFIDIGLHNDGLVHISEITSKYIKHPSEVLTVGDIVDCYVKKIFKEKEKVALTLKEM